MQADVSPFDNANDRRLLQPSPNRGLQVPEIVTRSLSASGDRRDSPTTEQRIAQRYAPLRGRQDPNLNVSSTSQIRWPMHDDFGEHLGNMFITPPDDDENDLENAIILLHDYGRTEAELMLFHKKPLRQPRTVYLYPRGPYPALTGGKGNYSWAEQAPPETFAERQANSATNDNLDFEYSSKILLEDIIKDGLIKNCSFSPSNIVILGQKQGGMVALTSVAAWDLINFGGVISIGALLPTFVAALRGNELSTIPKVHTPAMVITGDADFSAEPTKWQQTKALFTHLNKVVLQGTLSVEGSFDDIQKKWQPLLDFYAHRLRKEEWTKQSIITFDGGGIRGYGSLLILRQLMMEIGDEETRQGAEDGIGESSFAPCEYKPRRKVGSEDYEYDFEPTPTTRKTLVSQNGGLATARLPNSSLFLPCHYFNYAGGTSTGGLIAIMLSRFRMTVDDCIHEYEVLGEKVFGNPRPPSMKGLLWHKFDSKVLRQVIEDVTIRRAEIQHNGQVMYPCPRNRCQTVVLAFSDLGTSDTPYLFRTYNNPQENQGKRTTSRTTGFRLRNGGDAQNIPIADVGRATSAAPNFFKPAEIQIGGKLQRFKDGGFGANNPSHLTYTDVILKHGNVRTCIGPFVSIGTGDSDVNLFTKKRGGWLRNGHVRNWLANLDAVIHQPSRTKGAHESMEAESATDSGHKFPYLRLDGGEQLGSIKLDEWHGNHLPMLTGEDETPGIKTLKKIRAAVAEYLLQDDVRSEIQKMAKILVQRRRLRTRDESAWDQYASASYYECSFKGCVRERIETLRDYLDHVKNEHKDETPCPKDDRRCWLYRDD